jgi:4-amino-4-deoxy-L-arabinose transferase-like glycosyltransferase
MGSDRLMQIKAWVDEKTGQIVAGFVALHVLFWTLCPSLFQKNIALDVMEGLVWGREWQLGYYKHPPLQAWLLDVMATLSGRMDFAIYLLPQLMIGGAFISIYFTARRLMDPARALLAVLLLEANFYYNFTTPEFNPNVLQIPFWALALGALLRALQDRKMRDWLWLGLWIGVCGYAKYSVALLAGLMGLFLLLDRDARFALKGAGPWVAAGVALLVLAPHLWWLHQHAYLPFKYAESRVVSGENWTSHLVNPLDFIGGQIPALIFMIALFLTVGRPRLDTSLARPQTWPFETRFAVWFTVLPLAVLVLASAVTGAAFKVMWATPFWSLAGASLLLLFPPVLNEARLRRFAAGVLIVFCLGLAGYWGHVTLSPSLFHKGNRAQFPGAEMARRVQDAWAARTGHAPLAYVVGEAWVAGNVAYYGRDRPSVWIDSDPVISPWIDVGRVRQQGAVLIWRDDKTKPAPLWLARFPAAEYQPPLVLPWQTRAAIEPVQINWAIVPPLGGLNGR